MSSHEVARAIQESLGPYIRPREEASHIRRVLASYLDSCLEDVSATGPLALVEPTKPASSAASRSLHREYIEALNANLKARKDYGASYQENASATRVEGLAVALPKLDHLKEHLATISLQKKQERLQAVEKHLVLLKQKPAASPDFLDPEEIFGDSRPLPDVPRDVVTALTINNAPSATHLKELIDQLEKHVLRTKLLLKREEQLLEQVKSRSSATQGTITDSAKLEALDTARNELIKWIETELGKAGDGGGSEDGEHENHRASGTARLDEQLAGIKEKYTRYLEARKALLQLVSQQATPIIKPRTQDKTVQPTSTSTPNPPANFLSPYLEQLLSVAHEQKGLIAQKSHLNTIIAKQLRENCHALDRLAEESQLIPAHPAPGTTRHKPAAPAFSDALRASETLDASSRVKPWVFAADSAKIATLEVVAEKIEEGQLAIEGSMRTISEIDQLLKPHASGQGEEGGNSEGGGEGDSVEDIWLAESRPSGKSTSAQNIAGKGAGSRSAGDVWDMLDGNLGLLRVDLDPP
ncbi:hypothetical protein B0H67DRAFT_562535 [Lasiosphaeris hirsuta]|uniref:Uncharacterized protein n=1 Tax=Lasiosphaeris hirsuta TaxID=260670 RepID=A0AA40BAP1_9PEZI|nr:hypothetical protein B0H67DRAFT_562535 [Lasiosphaeris hirsuta]